MYTAYSFSVSFFRRFLHICVVLCDEGKREESVEDLLVLRQNETSKELGLDFLHFTFHSSGNCCFFPILSNMDICFVYIIYNCMLRFTFCLHFFSQNGVAPQHRRPRRRGSPLGPECHLFGPQRPPTTHPAPRPTSSVTPRS